MPALSQIYLYPVKSLAGFQVEQWPVDRNGLQYDRKWMLVDADGGFLSQRRLPKMALIQTRIEARQLILSAPGKPDIAIDVNSESGDRVPVEIWNDRCIAKSVAKDIDRWLGEFLQTDCRLVYHPDDQIRQVDQRFALRNDQTAFSDGFPFLIVSHGSLAALNRHLAQAVDMLRFRPNLVIHGCADFAEDSWRRIVINGIEFRLPKPCSRCSIPNIDPVTALAQKEPMATLNRLRKHDNKIYFGQNALHDRVGHLAVGQSLQILETGPLQPPIAWS